MSPNVVVVKPKSTRYFKIPLKNTRPPLKILIFNSDGHEYKVYVSKKCRWPNQENYDAMYTNKAKITDKDKDLNEHNPIRL